MVWAARHGLLEREAAQRSAAGTQGERAEALPQQRVVLLQLHCSKQAVEGALQGSDGLLDSVYRA